MLNEKADSATTTASAGFRGSSVTTANNSNSGSSRGTYAGSSSSGTDKDKETPERWRDRLWPARALHSFCRALLRCEVPDVKPGQKIQIGDSNVRLTPHWNSESFKGIQNQFDNLSAHNAAFFLLLVEESRESSIIDYVQHYYDTGVNSSSNSSSSQQRGGGKHQHHRPGSSSSSGSNSSNGWVTGEVLQVVSETAVQSQMHQSQQSDPRLGSVWLVRLALSPYLHNQGGQGSNSEDMSDSCSPGDLLVLRSNSLDSRPLLGIVQGWDPDLELKYGSTMKHTTTSSMPFDPEAAANNHGTGLSFQTQGSSMSVTSCVNVFMCVGNRYVDPLGQLS